MSVPVFALALFSGPAFAAQGAPSPAVGAVPSASAAAEEGPKPKRIGGAVSAPVVISHVDPEFSAEARKERKGGSVLVGLWVDELGNPTHVHLVRGVGYGLDESAVSAVQQYRFKPAMEDGKPVTVELNIEVNFKISDKPVAASAAAGLPAPNLPVSQPAASGVAAPAYAGDPKFQKALMDARDRKQPVDERLARWKNANKIAKEQCVECLHQIVALQMSKGQWKDAVAASEQLEHLSAEPRERFFAESQRAIALLHANNDNPKPEQLKEAEASLTAALAISPRTTQVVYMEGRALAMMGREEEAKAEFTKYLDLVGMSDAYRTRAEHFIENPRLAAMHMAPPFTLTTSEGEEMSLDNMNGKVVLLDFWATWCGPCKETLPEIQRIAKDFAGQPLVVISISQDASETEWRAYMDKNRMTWPQYRDANGALSAAYGVHAIPQFFTIDTDGVLESVRVGSNADVVDDIRRLVGKARDAEKKRAKEMQRASAGE